MRDDEASEVLKTVAERLAPSTWRLRWLEDRLPEGRTLDVARRAGELIGQAQRLMREEAEALDKWSPNGPSRPIPNYFIQAEAAAAAAFRVLEALRARGLKVTGSGGDFAVEVECKDDAIEALRSAYGTPDEPDSKGEEG